MGGPDVEAGTSIGTENVELARQRSGADIMMVDTPAVYNSKHQELGWCNLAYSSSPTCSQQAGQQANPASIQSWLQVEMLKGIVICKNHNMVINQITALLAA